MTDLNESDKAANAKYSAYIIFAVLLTSAGLTLESRPVQVIGLILVLLTVYMAGKEIWGKDRKAKS